jgi:metallo-beta-lactamase class B
MAGYCYLSGFTCGCHRLKYDINPHMRRLLLLLTLLVPVSLRAEANPDWTTPLTPFRIADNLYYVGSRDLASYLITTPAGNILINANLDTSAAQIRASVEKLGFRWADTKVLLDSQAHFDHVGGAAKVLRETHARNMVMEGDDNVMSTGGHADFAFGDDITTAFTPTRVDRVLHDGSAIELGDLKHGGVQLIAHKTAGHTRGCTTFTLRAHIPGDPANQLRDIVIVGGFAALPHYRFIATPGHPASYPGISTDFERTFATLHALPCDIFLGAHGVYFNLLPKLDRMPKEGPAVFIDPTGYQAQITDAQHNFEAALARQRASVR